MTTTQSDVDTARAQDLNEAHVAWCMHPMNRQDRLTFGAYAIGFLRERHVELQKVGGPSWSTDEPTPLADGRTLAAALGLPDDPYSAEAVEMSLREVADLLAALAERDLRWTPGQGDRCGTLLEGAPEPPDLHVVFDAYRAAWQRHGDRALDEGEPCAHWFGPNGARLAWPDLQRRNGPLTPDGGIAPTAPQGEQS